ncbi:MAG: peptidoglycan-binding protein [Fibrobacteria bacterium]|nr:peptidoglycan-binding protein [Fibrobacteria bacterium]
MNSPYPHASPFGVSSPFDGPSLLDRYQGKPVGDIRFPKAATPQRPAVDPDYLAKTRENDPWPEGSSCAPPSDKPPATTPSVVLSNCRFLTPPDQLRFNEPFEMAVDVRRTAPGKTRRAFFDLHQSWIRDGVPEEQSIVRGIEGFPDSDGDTHTIKAKEVLETAMPYVLGETVEFWLTATHLEASEPATSPKVQVALHHHAHWLGGSDILFDLGSSFPRLGPDGRLASVLAAALKRTANPPHPENPETTICFGHASASGNANHNRKLSLRRAQAVKAILDRDEKAWETLAVETFRTADLQQFLADLAQSEGIGCDPGTIDGVNGPDTKSGVTAFQIHANSTWNLGLEVDGDCGRRTWKAILRQILALVQQELGKDPSKAPEWKTPLWGHEGKGVYGNGEDFAGAQENPEERSVQITFFAGGSEPILKDVPENTKVTTQDNPVEDASSSKKVKIPPNEDSFPPVCTWRVNSEGEHILPQTIELQSAYSKSHFSWIVHPNLLRAPDGTWGSIKMIGTEEYPNDLTCSITKSQNHFRATLHSYKMEIGFKMVSRLSNAWNDPPSGNWNKYQSLLIGKENLAVEERKNRTLAHEYDHYKCYIRYWNTLMQWVRAFEKSAFASEDEVVKSLKLLNANNCIAFIIAEIQATSFDLLKHAGGLFPKVQFYADYTINYNKTLLTSPIPLQKSRTAHSFEDLKKILTVTRNAAHDAESTPVGSNARESMCFHLFSDLNMDWILE